MLLLLLLAALVIVCAVTGWAVVKEIRRAGHDRTVQTLMAIFGPASARAQHDPRELLVWHPLARAARHVFPEAFQQIEAALQQEFPFSREVVQAAHARWTTEWLTWERTHDLEYAVRIKAVEEEIDRAGGSGVSSARARLAALEQEKLERYQQRYQEYVHVAKALAALEGGHDEQKALGVRR